LIGYRRIRTSSNSSLNEVYRIRFSKGVTDEQIKRRLFLAALNTENLFGESAMRLEVQETLLMGTFANRELSALLTHYSHWIPNVTPGMPLHSLTRGKTGST
jgi:hypothetical protein